MKLTDISLILSWIGAAATAYAAQKNDCKMESNHNAKTECASLCFAGPVLECDNSLEVMGAALYAQVRADASTVALLNGSTEAEPAGPKQANGIEPIEKASWGFKVGLGWKTGHDDWKLSARYTWLRAITNGKFEQPYGNAYIPTAYSNPYIATAGNSPLNLAVSYGNLEAGNYTLISDLNLYLVRQSLLTNKLEVSPYFGIDFNLIQRRQTITFSHPNVGNYGAGGYVRTYDRNFWWGVGPMAGISSSWLVGYNLSVVAQSYLALTYGQSQSYADTSSYDSDDIIVPNENYTAVISNDFYQFSPDLYFQLGLEWGKNFDNDSKAIALRIAYENDYYFQVNKTIVNDLRYRKAEMGAIGYQGLVLQGQFDF
jgi:hypothetical protein